MSSTAKPVSASAPAAAPKKKAGPTDPLYKALPDAWRMLRPAPLLVIGGFALMIVNRVAGLVLPFMSKSFVDGVLWKGQSSLLPSIVTVVLTATLVGALTSYALAQ